jgi:hypothetical protein
LNEINDTFGVCIHNFDDLNQYDDLDDVAALAAALDGAICVSTAISAITAGVGTPTKLALWRQSDWSNLLYRPIGPSVQVFERNTGETWKAVLQDIAKDISEL